MPRNDHIRTKKREWGSVGWIGSSIAPAQILTNEQKDLWIALAEGSDTFTGL